MNRLAIRSLVSLVVSGALAVAVAASCGNGGGGNSGTDGSTNTTTDLSVLPDLAVSSDLTTGPDLSGPQVALSGIVYDFSSSMPLAGVSVCFAPLNSPCVTTGADGSWTMMGPQNSQLGISFALAQYTTAITEITTAAVAVPFNFDLIKSGTVTLLELSVGQSEDDTKGVFAVSVRDANGKDLAGGVITATPTAGFGPYYFTGSVPDTKATATSANGLAVYANVVPGDYSLTATAPNLTCASDPILGWAGTAAGSLKVTAVANTLISVGFVCK